MLLQNCFCFQIALINDTFDFLIDRSRHFFTVSSGCVTKITSDKDFIAVIVIVDQTKTF